MLTSCLDRQQVETLAARLSADLQYAIDMGDEGALQVSGTIGISWLEEGLAERDLLRRADLALYRGKHTSPGAVISYSPSLEACVHRTR